MKTLILANYIVTFRDGMGHEKEMIFLKDREYAANDAAARLHGTCHEAFRYIEEVEPMAQNIVIESNE